jgi:hypothetical protein
MNMPYDRLHFRTLLPLVVALSACSSGSDGPSSHLLGPRDERDPKATSDHLRSLQMVRVLVKNPDDPNPNAPPLVITKTAEDVIADLSAQCENELDSTTRIVDETDPSQTLPLCQQSGGCIDYVCNALRQSCAAQLALEIVSLRAAPVIIDFTDDLGTRINYSIPPQSAATNSALGAFAAGAAREAMTSSGPAALGRAFGLVDQPPFGSRQCHFDTVNGLGLGTVDGRTLGTIAANTFSEAYQLQRESTLKAVDADLAVADAHAGATSPENSVEASVAGEALSRVAAAHLLVGGNPGLLGSTNGIPRAGLCSAPQLSAQAQKALSVIRESGVSPAAVLLIPGEIDPDIFPPPTPIVLDDFLDGTASQVPDGSVRQRLSELWKYDFANPPPGIAAGASVAEYMKLEKQDFADARSYLAQEIRAFSRSMTATLDPVGPTGATPSGACHDTMGQPVLCRRYAATSGAPPTRSPVFYSTIVRHDTARDGSPSPDLRDIDGMGALADGVDAAQAFAHALLGSQSQMTSSNDREIIMDAMSLLVNSNERTGRFTFCQEGPQLRAIVDQFDIKASPGAPSPNLRLVLGDDGLACAVDGTIEGARCDDPANPGLIDPHLLFMTLQASTTPPAIGFTSHLEALGTTEPPDRSRVYLVRRRDGITRDAPGAFEALAGMTYTTDVFSGPEACIEVPIEPEVDQAVANIMQPSKAWCTAQRISCAGTDLDARMPLEDELTNDNNGIESSWKHYLDLARQAAAEADQLGQTFLQAGIELDQRQETIELQDAERERVANDRAIAAVEELQNICGTSVDPTRLLKLLTRGNDDADPLTFLRKPTPCSTDAACNSPPDAKKFRCLFGDPRSATPSGTCVANIQSLLDQYGNTDTTIRPDLDRLQKCLDEGVHDFVHMGSEKRALCLWHEPNDKRQICVGASGEHPCPVFESSNHTCSTLNPPNGKTVVRVDKTLDLIDTLTYSNDNLQGNQSLSACDAIRAKRGRTPISNRADESRKILNHEGFDLNSARDIARKVGFAAAYGGYASITLDNVVLYTTGTPWEGKSLSGNWPCTTGTPPGCPGPGLFCDVADCGDLHARARLNNRMFGAVAALRATTLDAPRNVTADTLLAAGTVIYPGIVPEQICNAGNCATLNLGDPSTRLLFVNSQVAERIGGSVFVGRVYDQADAPQGRIAYSFPTAGGFADLDTAALGGFTVPARYAGARRVGFALDQVFMSQDPRDGYNIAHPANFWTCMGRDQHDCGKFDPQDGQRCVTETKCIVNPCTKENVHAQGRDGQGCGCTTTTNCASGYFNAALSNDSGAVPPPMNAKVRIFGAVDADPAKPNDVTRGDPATDPDVAVPFDFTFDKSHMLDGLELLCELQEAGAASAKGATITTCGIPPVVNTIDDLEKAEKYIRCTAGLVTGGAGRAVLAEFPESAFDPLRKDSAVGAFPGVGGTSGISISELRAALLDLATTPPAIAEQMAEIADHVEAVRIAAHAADLKKKIHNVTFHSQIVERIAQCAIALSPSVSIGFPSGGSISGNPGAALATCANSAAQIGFAAELNDLESQLEDNEFASAMNQFQQRFSETMTKMQGFAIRLTHDTEVIDRQLAQIELQKSQARRALARALFADSFQSKFQAKINAVLWKRFLLDQRRYQEALTTAKRMAFLAKRSIEMRLGMRLSEMTQDLPLVGAPATWESSICTNTGIDFQKTVNEAGSLPNDFEFTDPFIGDYVRKLEGVVESYRLVNSFHEGGDTAVISLRDDVQNVRAACDVPVNNQLFFAGELDQTATETRGGWERTGCAANPDGSAVADCIGIFALDTPPLIDGSAPFSSGAKGYRLHFGDGGSCPPATCGFTAQSALIQRVDMVPGRYRASMFLSDPANPPKDATTFTDVGLVIRPADGSSPTGILSTVVPTTVLPAVANVSWARAYTVFDVLKPVTIAFGFKPPTVSATETLKDVVVGGPMLESIGSQGSVTGAELAALLVPGGFVNTTDALSRRLDACEDTDGTVFRAKGWHRGNVRLCPDGFSGDCQGEQATDYGFWETSFTLNQRDIEAGKMLVKSGFARGNFNYRIDSIAANFVGTGIHDCTNSDLPSTCFASGFVQYSLTHQGPYYVRNHIGKDFLAELPTGVIENARGLATERYVTNPVSSADQTLLTEYMRTELQGRPMDGNFILRVWDADGLDFNSIQDVQIVLKYRYWTRFR